LKVIFRYGLSAGVTQHVRFSTKVLNRVKMVVLSSNIFIRGAARSRPQVAIRTQQLV